jgi:hypothetical protein
MRGGEGRERGEENVTGKDRKELKEGKRGGEGK